MATAASELNVSDLPADFATTSTLYRFSVERYLQLGDAGYFDDGPNVELLAGVIVAKMNKNPRHTVAKRILARELLALIPHGWDVLQEDPIRLTSSVPEPDLTIARGRPEDYLSGDPMPANIGLVVEVSDTSLSQDRNIKRRLYAEAAIVEYWIVNLVEQRIEVYTQPSGPTASPDYANRRDYVAGDDVPLTLDGQTIGVVPLRDVLPALPGGEG